MIKPHWFKDNLVLVSSAKSCGIAQGGRPKFLFDSLSGKPMIGLDEETGAPTELLDDELSLDVEAAINQESTDTLRYVESSEVPLSTAVPVYYDEEYEKRFNAEISLPEFADFSSASLGELIEKNWISVTGGHGSPSSTQRVGETPYIKVSDLRAGLVNINPTNRVPVSVAKRFWGGSESGLQAFDLLSPARTSKNIGDFCVLLPDQEEVVLTKEILRIRACDEACFDQFYLIWALSLKVVRDQWKRIVFMQTNREDVGQRFREIKIPIPAKTDAGERVSAEFRNYYSKLATARSELGDYLTKTGKHHFFVTG